VVTSQNGNTNTYTVTVTRQTTLQTWQQTWYASTSTTTGNSAYTADPYSTGISNLLVFAYLGPNQNPATARVNLLPQPQLSGGNLFFSFTEPSGVGGITYGAQWSATLLSNSWTTVSDTGSGAQHLFSVPVGSNTQLFMRLTATVP